MKSTLADIKQLFNVKAIAYNTNITALAEGQFGIFPEGSDISVPTGTTYATLPTQFRLVSKLNGKLYYSFNTIEKTKMFNQVAKDYVSEQVNIWETVIEKCNCINGVTLKLNVSDQSLIQRDGLTWTHSDFVVAVSPEELLCKCSCDGTNPVYENNVITQVLSDKVNALNSPFYESSIAISLTGIITYANQGALTTAVPAPAQGALALVTGSGLKQYNGTAWIVVGTITGTITDVTSFIATNKAVNTDTNTANNGQKLKLVIKGKLSPVTSYKDLDVNYIYPRGVKLNPALTINNGESNVIFIQTQALRFEVGAGYDLRAEEFESMSLYTNLNFYPRLSDGIQNPDLVYQFENFKNYKTITFEFSSEKSGLQDVPEGDSKKFGVLFGTENAGIFTELSAMFVV